MRRAISCRDLAVLFIAAACSLGFGARVVRGYLYRASADAGSPAAIGAGATYAWADIYVPGLSPADLMADHERIEALVDLPRDGLS